MGIISWLAALWDSISPDVLAACLALACLAMALVEDRRVAILPLLAQLTMVTLLRDRELYRPVAVLRLVLGVAVCAVLYVSARHVERERPRRGFGLESRTTTADGAPRALITEGLRTSFRFLTVLLGTLLAYGLALAYPVPAVPAHLGAAMYWLVTLGVLLVIVGGDPLRIGYGLIALMSGFQAVYLFLERGLLVIGLVSLLDVFVALGIALCTESWVDEVRLGLETEACEG